MKTSKPVWDQSVLEQLDPHEREMYFKSVIKTAQMSGISLKKLAKKLGMSRRKMEKLAGLDHDPEQSLASQMLSASGEE